MEYWFTSDLHFDHANIIEYSKRPFTNVEDMNLALLDNLNTSVKAADRLFILGDFCMAWSKARPEHWLGQINCKNIYFIFGNHDKPLRKNEALCQKYFKWYGDLLEFKDLSPRIIMCHYALRVWNNSHHGSWHLYGHSHGSLMDDITMRSIDVGVDCNNYKPFHYDEIAVLMNKKQPKAVDHHTSETT